MKSICTLLFTLYFGAAAFANANNQGVVSNPIIEAYVQTEFSKVGHLLDSGTVVGTEYNEVETATENEVARLYKFKNSRIKKALAFRTKRNKAKMA